MLIDYKELMLDWDESLNPGLEPKKISHGSHVVINWKCHKCGRVWSVTVKSRTLSGTGCTCDAMERKSKALRKKMVEKRGSLAMKRPDLAAQWHPTMNGELTPNDITCGSEYKAWWIDSSGKVWQSAVNVRNRNLETPDVIKNKLIVGYTDLATVNPKLASEWNYEKNTEITPEMVMPHSKDRVWWICDKGHEWQATVTARTSGRGCPICNKERNTSFPEQALYYYIKKLVPSAKNRFQVENRLEVDVFLPEWCIALEYDGAYFHSSERKKRIDERKNTRLKELGVKLIRVIEEGLKVPAETEIVVYEQFSKKHAFLDQTIITVLNSICSLTGLTYDFSVNLERDQNDIWELYIISEKKNSIAETAPYLLEEWHPTRNGKVEPQYIQRGSNKKFWWQCSKCGYEWQATAFNRVKGNGCPVCAGNIVAEGINDLSTTHPELVEEWHNEKNIDMKPTFYSAGSGKSVWWKCRICGHEWKALISNRSRGRGCPHCAGKKNNKTIYQGHF